MRASISKSVAAITLLVVMALPRAAWAKPVEVWDPLEGMNRGIFWFNDKFDIYLLHPVSRAYDYITPDPVQTGITNFFLNIRYPIYLVSDVLRLDFSAAARDTGRFAVNTTAGLLGVFDIAKGMGLEYEESDIGMALAVDGVPPGPYLVLPFLGPSNLRDAPGRLVNLFIHPSEYVFYFGGMSYRDKYLVSYGSWAIDFVNQRAHLEDAVKAAKENSFDYYLFMQGAYYQYREGMLNKGVGTQIENDDEFDTDAQSSDLPSPGKLFERDQTKQKTGGQKASDQKKSE